GPFQPENGHLFNPAKILLDPYARAIGRDLIWDDSLYGFEKNTGQINLTDSAPVAPLAAVIDRSFTWGDDKNPQIPWEDTILYELHVKGFTAQLYDIPESLRGTYAGLATEPCIRYLQELGITSVELMPVHHSISEHVLHEADLTNYWGYNTLSYFAP